MKKILLFILLTSMAVGCAATTADIAYKTLLTTQTIYTTAERTVVELHKAKFIDDDLYHELQRMAQASYDCLITADQLLLAYYRNQSEENKAKFLDAMSKAENQVLSFSRSVSEARKESGYVSTN
jgi:hypothetical protein